MAELLRRHFVRIIIEGGSIVIFSILLICQSGSANPQNPSYQAAGPAIEDGASSLNSLSPISQVTASWLSVVSWTCVILIALLAVFLVLWSLASVTASLLPEIPAGSRPAVVHRLDEVRRIAKSAGSSSSSISIPSTAHALPHHYDRIFPSPGSYR